MNGAVGRVHDPEFAALQVHQARRAAGVPTVITFVARRAVAVAFAQSMGLADIVCGEPSLPAVVKGWVAALLGQSTAAMWLASCMSRADPAAAAQWAAELDRKPAAELRLFLERTVATRFTPEALQVAEALLCSERLPGSADPSEAIAFVSGLQQLAGPTLPSLLLAPASSPLDQERAPLRAASFLAELAATAPSASLSLVLEPDEAEALLRMPPSRARSLVCAGFIHVGGGPLRQPVLRTPNDPRDVGSAPFEVREDDAARSAAESFLFERLSAHPETAGRFELNGRIEVAGLENGPHLLEIDLLARPLKLAIEIDGFHHFQDAAAYRRDRRKDLLLQRAGFQVLRVLADDVVSRLEEILKTVVRLVRERSAKEARR